jgi:hypothetical protein
MSIFPNKTPSIKCKPMPVKYEPFRHKKHVADITKNAILCGYSNEEVIDIVVDAYPVSKISSASVDWYRESLRKEGLL